LARDEAHDVGGEALGGELLLDIGREAVLVLLERRDGVDGLFDGGHYATSRRRAPIRE
jgi:hypothetical protein